MSCENNYEKEFDVPAKGYSDVLDAEVESVNMIDSTNTSTEEDSIREVKEKIRVSDFVGYFIYIIELLYSIFIRYGNFSFDLTLKVGDEHKLGLLMLRLISYTSGRLLLWIALYGVIATFFRRKFLDFYKWFTIASILVFVVSLLVLVVKI